MDYLSTPMYFCKLHAAWKKTTIFLSKKQEGGRERERETILVHPCCLTSCMQHGKKRERWKWEKNYFLFKKCAIFFILPMQKHQKTHSVIVCET